MPDSFGYKLSLLPFMMMRLGAGAQRGLNNGYEYVSIECFSWSM